MRRAKHLAFTGSSINVTPEQIKALKRRLSDQRDLGFLWMHNGDCVIGDEVAAKVWRELKGKVMLHPPSLTSKRARLKADITCEPANYLTRNGHLVELSEVLVATPRTKHELLRGSGTWSTIRRARQFNLTIYIIFPDGTCAKEGDKG